MNLEIFTLCDYVSDYGQGKLNVMGTFDTVNAPAFPFSLPQCAVAGRVRVGNHEAGKRVFEIRFLDSEGNAFQQPINGELNISPNPNADYSAINLPFNFSGLTFKKAGKYAVELHWDGEFVSGLTINVLDAARGGQRPS